MTALLLRASDDLDGVAPPVRAAVEWAREALEPVRWWCTVHHGQSALEPLASALSAILDGLARRCHDDGSPAGAGNMLLVCPDVSTPDGQRLVAAAGRACESEYASAGLLLSTPPVALPDAAALLTVRALRPADFPLLRDEPQNVAAYLARFGDHVPVDLHDEVWSAVATFGLTTSDTTETSTEVTPLSPAQQRLWFLNQLDPGNPVRHVAVARRLRGPLDTESLAAG